MRTLEENTQVDLGVFLLNSIVQGLTLLFGSELQNLLPFIPFAISPLGSKTGNILANLYKYHTLILEFSGRFGTN
jgi:hypothetical protein